MATNELTRFGLAEVANRTDPDGKTAKIAEVLMKKSPFVKNMLWMESNDKTQNKTVRRAAEPIIEDRRYYEGPALSSSKTIPLWDKIGTVEGQENIDREIALLAPEGVKTYLNQESISFASKFSKTIDSRLIYSDGYSDPDRPTGLKARLDNLSNSNVVNNGGTTADSCTSIYIVNHSKDYCYGIYPKDSKAGLEIHMSDLIPNLRGDNNSEYMGWKITMLWRYGLVVPDPLGIGRVCNIDDTTTFDETKLAQLIVAMDTNDTSRIYVNRRMKYQMWDRILTKDTTALVMMKPTNEHVLDSGGPPIAFAGIPIQLDEQILDTEAIVS